jgi:hypothetical protein
MAGVVLPPIRAAVESGKLIGYEIYQNGGALVESVRFDTPISNYMNNVMLERLCKTVRFRGNPNDTTFSYSARHFFQMCQLGTGTSANPRPNQDIEAPILTAVNFRTDADKTGTATGGFRKTDADYTHAYFQKILVTDPNTNEESYDIRVRWRMSHRHTVVPSNQATPIVVSEIGWTAYSDAIGNDARVSSRIVLPPEKRITLVADQFLVTIYEVEFILPNSAPQPFSNLPITGAFQWSNLSTYALNQVVTDGGVNYKSLINSNIGNVPANTVGTAWAVDTSTTLALSGVYAFRGWYPPATVQFSGIRYSAALNNLFGRARVISSNTNVAASNNSFSTAFGDDASVVTLGTAAAMLNPGDMDHRGIIIGNGAGSNVGSVSFDESNAATGKLTATATIARDADNTVNAIKSIFIFGYQFLLDLPICRSSDRAVSITASIQWSLVRELNE